jgi:hypothetical protein
VEYPALRKPNIPSTVTREVTAKARFRNRLNFKIGVLARVSTATNAASRTPPMMNDHTT